MDGVASNGALSQLSGVLTTVDLVVIVLLLGSMAIGFWTGFVWQFVRIAGLVVSLWVSWLYHPVVAEVISFGIPEPLRMVIGATAVFVGALMVCYLLAFLFRDLINALKPELPDRILGAVFGMLKGVMLIGFVAFLIMRFLAPGNPVRERVEDSKGAVAAATCVRTFLYVLPERFSQDADPDSAASAIDPEVLRRVLGPTESEPEGLST